MFSKANLTSTILTALWGYFGGLFFWGYLTVDFFNGHLGSATGVMKEGPDMLYLVLGCLINAFVFSTIYGKWANGKFSVGSGITLGVWFAILLGLGEGFINYSTTNVVDLTGMLGNFGVYLVFMVILGALAGFSYNKMS